MKRRNEWKKRRECERNKGKGRGTREAETHRGIEMKSRGKRKQAEDRIEFLKKPKKKKIIEEIHVIIILSLFFFFLELFEFVRSRCGQSRDGESHHSASCASRLPQKNLNLLTVPKEEEKYIRTEKKIAIFFSKVI